MKDISNKELIQKLKVYFLSQDREDVAYLLAASMVDINRVLHQNQLGEKEKIFLIARLQAMDNEIQEFIVNGPRGKMQIHKFNSDNF